MKRSFWRKLQSGQALSEYWPTLGGAVAFLTIAAGVSLGIWNYYRTAVDTFNRVGSPAEVCTQTQDSAEGGNNDTADFSDDSRTSLTNVSDYQIVLVGNSYDSATDRTTLAYRVTSGSAPSISHVTFGLADCANVAQTSERTEWGTDPRTGVSGLKFDTGYEDGETRTVYVTLRGQYQMGSIGLGVKAGGSTLTGTITGPTQCAVDEPDDTQEDITYSGCVPD